MLELVAGRIGVDVELKEDGYVEQAMAIVKLRLAPEQYVVTSFRTVLPPVKRDRPGVRTGLLLSPRRQIGAAVAPRGRNTKVDFVAPAPARLARAGLLGWAAARELPSWVWTVNDRRALRLLPRRTRASPR